MAARGSVRTRAAQDGHRRERRRDDADHEKGAGAAQRQEPEHLRRGGAAEGPRPARSPGRTTRSGLSELSEKTGASKASTYRMLSTLESRGFVVKRGDTRKYAPGVQ